MPLPKPLSDFIKRRDMFSQPVTFRYNQQPAFQTVTGGCISIITIMIFIGIFASTLLKTIDKEYIDFNTSRHDQESPSYFVTTIDKTFMFAISLENIDMNSGVRYFDVGMEFRNATKASGTTKHKFELVACEREVWESRGFGKIFTVLKLEKWLCPKENTFLELQGKYVSDVFKYYKISISKCKAATDLTRPCVTSADIQTFLDTYQTFGFNYYFINTIINPGDPDYLKTYLDDLNYFQFTINQGTTANLFISEYKIDTDESLWPNEDVRTDVGGIVLEIAQQRNFEVRRGEYMKFYLRKSPISLAITRSFRKVDDTLSYIGGLLGTILLFLSFANMYNQLAYELQISKNSYYYDKNDPFNTDSFNMGTFFIYLFFSFCDSFNIKLQWPKYKRLHRFLQQGRRHLDMRLIIRKILYAEKLGLLVLDKYKHKALLLSEPFTLEEAEGIRRDLKFYKRFRKKFFPNGEQLGDCKRVLTMGLRGVEGREERDREEGDREEGNGGINGGMNRNNDDRNGDINDSSMNGSNGHINIDNNISNQINNINSNPNNISTLSLPYNPHPHNPTQQSLPMPHHHTTPSSSHLTDPSPHPHPIQHQQQFLDQDQQVRTFLAKLKEEADEGDFIAVRLLGGVDERVRGRYLGEGGMEKEKAVGMGEMGIEGVGVGGMGGGVGMRTGLKPIVARSLSQFVFGNIHSNNNINDNNHNNNNLINSMINPTTNKKPTDQYDKSNPGPPINLPSLINPFAPLTGFSPTHPRNEQQVLQLRRKLRRQVEMVQLKK